MRDSDYQLSEKIFTARSGKKTLPLLLLSPKAFKQWCSQAADALAEQARLQGFSGQKGESCLVFGQEETLLLGLGDEGVQLYTLGMLPSCTRQFNSLEIRNEISGEEATRAAIGFALGVYRFEHYKSKAEKAGGPKLVWPKGADKARVRAVADSICLGRDLVNTPANDMTPLALAAASQQMADQAGAEIRILKGEELVSQNYPAIYTVGQASVNPPVLIDMHWSGTKKKSAPRITLVGKGVTFDTGGLDIKPSNAMLNMRKDMGGAAHVIGLARMIMALKLPVHLRMLVPSAENSISGNAFRPGDIIQTRKGLSVEIGNTDAEGRLLLADALTAAGEEPCDMVFDFATLTGAARVALGADIPALMGNTAEKLHKLQALSFELDDPLWTLPLYSGYKNCMNGQFADLSNTGDGSTGGGGAITAGIFLEHFAPEKPDWFHIDTFAWRNQDRPGRPKGGDLQGVRAVLEYIESLL